MVLAWSIRGSPGNTKWTSDTRFWPRLNWAAVAFRRALGIGARVKIACLAPSVALR
jgi:hypothetical protein